MDIQQGLHLIVQGLLTHCLMSINMVSSFSDEMGVLKKGHVYIPRTLNDGYTIVLVFGGKKDALKRCLICQLGNG
jgi:hypothetical protein